MSHAPPSPTGLRPTLRQMMIVVLWAGLLFAITKRLLAWKAFGDRAEIACMTVPITLGTYALPLLAALIRGLDRRGPVRSWYVSSCMAGTSVVVGLAFLLQDPACIVLTGHPTMTFPLAPVLGVGCLWAAWHHAKITWPAACPICGQKALIPLAFPARPGLSRRRRATQRGWCATCGALFERDGKAPWRSRTAEGP